jgi:hypothetical protein
MMSNPQIYRLIHMDNLPIYLERMGLHSPNHWPPDGLIYKPIHNVSIQKSRKTTPIQCGPGGTIHDYIPFYFGPRSPMLLQLHTGRVEGYNEGQEPLIYLVSDVQTISQAGIGFVFSDGHGIVSYTSWFDDLVNLNKIDWTVVHARYWVDTPEDPDRQRKKQAEFLIHKFLPWTLITEIGVIDKQAEQKVKAILAQYSLTTLVRIQPGWYY